jgi:hypothetical protein
MGCGRTLTGTGRGGGSSDLTAVDPITLSDEAVLGLKVDDTTIKVNSQGQLAITGTVAPGNLTGVPPLTIHVDDADPGALQIELKYDDDTLQQKSDTDPTLEVHTQALVKSGAGDDEIEFDPLKLFDAIKVSDNKLHLSLGMQAPMYYAKEVPGLENLGPNVVVFHPFVNGYLPPTFPTIFGSSKPGPLAYERVPLVAGVFRIKTTFIHPLVQTPDLVDDTTDWPVTLDLKSSGGVRYQQKSGASYIEDTFFFGSGLKRTHSNVVNPDNELQLINLATVELDIRTSATSALTIAEDTDPTHWTTDPQRGSTYISKPKLIGERFSFTGGVKRGTDGYTITANIQGSLKIQVTTNPDGSLTLSTLCLTESEVDTRIATAIEAALAELGSVALPGAVAGVVGIAAIVGAIIDLEANKQPKHANLTALSNDTTPYLQKNLRLDVPGTANSTGLGAYQAALPNGGNVSLELGTAATTNNAVNLTFYKVATDNATNYAKLHFNGQTNGLWVRGNGSTGSDGEFGCASNIVATGYVSTPLLRTTPTVGGPLHIMGLGDDLGRYNLQLHMENNVIGNVRYYWDLTTNGAAYAKVLMLDGPNLYVSGKAYGPAVPPTDAAQFANKKYVDDAVAGGTTTLSDKADTTYVDTQDDALQTAIDGKQDAHANLTALSAAEPHLDQDLTLNVPGTTSGTVLGAYRADIADRGGVVFTLGQSATPNNAAQLTFNLFAKDDVENVVRLHIVDRPEGLWVDGSGASGADLDFEGSQNITAQGYLSAPLLRTTPTVGGALHIMGLGDNLGQYNLQLHMENNVVGNVRYYWDLTNAATTYSKVFMLDQNKASFSGNVSADGSVSSTLLRTTPNVNNAALHLMGAGGDAAIYNLTVSMENNVQGNIRYYWDVTNNGTLYSKVFMLDQDKASFSKPVTAPTPTASTHLATKDYVDTQDATKQTAHANLTALSGSTPTVPSLTVTNALKVGQITGSQTSQTANDTLILGNGSATGSTNFFIDFPSGKAGTWIWGFNMPKQAGVNGVMQVYNNSTDRQVLFAVDSVGTTGGDQRVAVWPVFRLMNPSGPLMTFYAGGVGPPTFTNRSLGTKISLRDVALTSTLGEWGFGVESGYSWSAVPDAMTGYKWYAGVTPVMTLTGTGNLTVPGTVTAATPTADTHLATKKYVDDHAGVSFTGQIGMTYQKTITKSDMMVVNGQSTGGDIVIGTRYKYDANPFFQTRNQYNCELRVTATFRIHSTNVGQTMKIQMAVHSAVGNNAPFPFFAYGKDQWVTLNQGSNASVVVVDNMKQSDYATEIAEASARGDLNPWVLMLTSPIWVTFRWTGVPTAVAWLEMVEHLSVQLTEVSA